MRLKSGVHFTVQHLSAWTTHVPWEPESCWLGMTIMENPILDQHATPKVRWLSRGLYFFTANTRAYFKKVK